MMSERFVSVERMLAIAFGDLLTEEELGEWMYRKDAQRAAEEAVRAAVPYAAARGWRDYPTAERAELLRREADDAATVASLQVTREPENTYVAGRRDGYRAALLYNLDDPDEEQCQSGEWLCDCHLCQRDGWRARAQLDAQLEAGKQQVRNGQRREAL